MAATITVTLPTGTVVTGPEELLKRYQATELAKTEEPAKAGTSAAKTAK